MPVFIAPVIGWALGALGAAVVAKVLATGWRRVNAHLHPGAPVAAEASRERIPTLRRDPLSGVYRPE